MLTTLGTITGESSANEVFVAPKLLVELTPWRRVFFENLRDLVWPRTLPPLVLTSKPSHYFWKRIFVPHPLPVASLVRSYLWHVLAIGFVCGLSLNGFLTPSTIELRYPLRESKLSYYPVDEYLPPLEPSKPAEAVRQEVARKGEPKLARQEIISVPPEPDNTHQTIIVPGLAKLKHDVALPNIVMSTPVLAAQPLPANALRRAPEIPQEVVAPAPDAAVPSRRAALNLPQDVVAPAPEITAQGRRPSLNLPADVVAPAPDPLPSNARARGMQTAVVEPPPTIDGIQRRAGTMNMTALTAKVAEPNLPVPVQRSGGVPGEAAGGGAGGASQAAPAPSAQKFGSGRSTRQLIALSLNPSAVEGPIETPAGNRRGAFAAGPQGKQDAPGTPEVLAGPKSAASQGSGSGKGSPSDEGVFVGKPPEGATISPIVANNSPVTSPTSSSQRAPDNAVRDKLMAAARPPDISRQPAPGAPPQTARTVEDSAFNGKRSYQLSLSMPNLNSSTGSWIIRFAELNPSRDTTDLSAPVPTTKVDPAYPPDLLRDRVEGTVVLYAIIRADGTITDIRVLNSVQERLDASAIKALGGWKFTPGTKHGTAVDLEAIVKIPFHARRMQF